MKNNLLEKLGKNWINDDKKIAQQLRELTVNTLSSREKSFQAGEGEEEFFKLKRKQTLAIVRQSCATNIGA